MPSWKSLEYVGQLLYESFGGLFVLTTSTLNRDALTPSQDFIISPHSACDDLYIATCGSFHGYKFLPVLGKYVVEMLDGLLDPALQKKWAWDREVPATENDLKWTHLELKEFAK